MRKISITSSSFTGDFQFTFLNGLLITIDFSGSELADEQKGWILRHAPLTTETLAEFVQKGKNLLAVDIEYEYSVEDFKKDYPYSRNMHLIPPLWKKYSPTERYKIMVGTKEYIKYCDRNKDWYKPKIAEAWLKKKEYLNDWKNM